MTWEYTCRFCNSKNVKVSKHPFGIDLPECNDCHNTYSFEMNRLPAYAVIQEKEELEK